jgi:3-oxoacyl-[acyl-carrier protein] reductase
MDFGIKDKVAFVTAASKGIGKESALALAREGVHVAICSRNSKTIKETAEEIEKLGVTAYGFVADLSESGSRIKAYEEVIKNLGDIDILVNNVGGGGSSTSSGSILEQSIQDYEIVLDLNFYTSIDLMKLAIPKMQEKKWGRVINIASIWGREYGGASSAYMTAKSALITITKSTARKVIKDGVCVNSVAPGMIKNEGNGWDKLVKDNSKEFIDSFIEQNLPAGKFGTVEPIGATVTFLASQQAGLISGACINVDGCQTNSLI